jgi:hypothetical protein
MGSKLNQTHAIAITLCVVVFALVLYMLVKIAGKRVNINGEKRNKKRRHGNKMWKKGSAKFHVILPEFPYGTLSESLIQPEMYMQMPKVPIYDSKNNKNSNKNFTLGQSILVP